MYRVIEEKHDLLRVDDTLGNRVFEEHFETFQGSAKLRYLFGHFIAYAL